MKIAVKQGTALSFADEAIVVGVCEEKHPEKQITELDAALKGHIGQAMRRRHFTGKRGQIVTADTLGAIPAGRIVVVGLGAKEKIKEETVRRASAQGAKSVQAGGFSSFATTLAGVTALGCDEARTTQAVVEGARLALYRFEKLKAEKEKKEVKKMTLLAASPAQVTAFKKGAKVGGILADSALFARDLVNLPGNFATPTHLANEAKKFAKTFGAKCKVFGPKEIAQHKMGGLMAVAQGSRQPARFIILEWLKGPKSQKPVVLVGKGLTFDTGGISIKPSANMEEMKSDMSGGAAVLGAMRAVAALGLKANVVGLVPSTENMPGGEAVKPGDVATGLSGVTMEIINTDAEGRLILSDALAYADRYKPDAIVDLATLTGACMVALGTVASGLFSTDETLVKELSEAGEETGERYWRLPLFREHEEMIKSMVADIKNVGPRWGGASTAAAFLKKHVKKGPWAHLDIAGTAYTTKASGYKTEGGVGVGVRSLIRFLEKRTGKRP